MRGWISLFSRLVAAGAVSLLALALIFTVILKDGERISVTLLLDALRRVPLGVVLVYAALQLVQGLLRAARYGALIRAGGETRPPRFVPLLCATIARNMFVDLLPARAGELSYAALLNRGCSVSGENALSSMGLSVYFDLMALLLVLAVALVGATQRFTLLGTLAVLAIALALGWLLLFYGAGASLRWSRRRLPRLADAGFAGRVFRWVEKVVGAVERVRDSGALARILLLSAAIRAVKYLALYLLFVGVTRPLWPALAAAPVYSVLIALIAAEAAASLPVPAFMSFGTYEAGGLLALTALGFTRADSMLGMLAMHVISQIVDYSWGALALIVFSFLARGAPRAAESPTPTAASSARRMAVALVWVVAAVLSAAFFARQWMRVRRLGIVESPPETGQALAPTADEQRRLRAVVAELRGFIVWSSNRADSHDLWMLTLPELETRRLTDHPHADTYPRVSPDGRRIVFCRSRLPRVSQRDPVPWDVWLLDMRSGETRRVAEHGYMPTWTEDGARIIFDRGGRQVIELDPETGEERVWYESGRSPIPEGVILQTPEGRRAEGRLAVTFRGRQRDTRLLGPGEASVRVGSGRGCQVNWAPDGSFVYYVDHGGRGGNTIFRAAPDGGDARAWLDLPEPYSHEYFPRLSRNGRWLVLGASAEGHEHDRADYEIFLWRVGEPQESAIRVTFHTGNDCWPDLYLQSEADP